MSLHERVNQFWPVFLATHLDPWNRRCHLVGNVVLFGAFAGFALSGWWPLLVVGVAGYVPSWIGHFLCERNRPATLQAPILSALCDLKMIGYMLSGELDDEIERLFGSRTPTPGTPVCVSPEAEKAYQQRMRLRVRAEMGPHPFEGYWEVFVLKHQNPINIWVHVFAMIYLYALLAFVVTTQRWELLIIIPLAQISGLVSHAFFERSFIDFDDALFSPRAFRCLNRMLCLVLTGRYGKELRRVQGELRVWQASQSAASKLSV